MSSRRRASGGSSGRRWSDKADREGSVVLEDEENENDGVGSEGGDMLDGVSDGESQGGGHSIGAERELDFREDEAEDARYRADMERDLVRVDEVEDGAVLPHRVKRKRSDEDDDVGEGEGDVEENLVPYMVPAFCQGCRCRQSVFVLGEVVKRRAEEVDKFLACAEERYGVSLRRGVKAELRGNRSMVR